MRTSLDILIAALAFGNAATAVAEPIIPADETVRVAARYEANEAIEPRSKVTGLWDEIVLAKRVTIPAPSKWARETSLS